jgi:hypothetical protein
LIKITAEPKEMGKKPATELDQVCQLYLPTSGHEPVSGEGLLPPLQLLTKWPKIKATSSMSCILVVQFILGHLVESRQELATPGC